MVVKKIWLTISVQFMPKVFSRVEVVKVYSVGDRVGRTITTRV